MNDPKAPPRPVGPQNLQISIDEAEGQGVYANLALIAHSNSEFILDFARVMPGIPKAKVHARVIFTPTNAKALHRALGENIGKFEAQYGAIQVQGARERRGSGAPEAENGCMLPTKAVPRSRWLWTLSST
jgi:hypothetical protein